MNLQERTQALLAVVDEYRRRRCAELLEPADAQARAIVRDALAEARRRVRTAIAEERQRVAAEVAAAEARLATERRLAAQRRATRMLALAWDRLRDELLRRWRDPDSRALGPVASGARTAGAARDRLDDPLRTGLARVRA
jgi:hypothetical protein